MEIFRTASREDGLSPEEIREAVYRELKDLGFLFVTLDLRGYRTGSMNATLKKPE